MKAFCFKCKKEHKMISMKKVKMKNGIKAVKGKCKANGTIMYRITGK